MAFRRSMLFCVLLFAATWLLAKDFWEQPFDKWKRDEVQRMLNDSPWAQSQTANQVRGGKDDTGSAGEKELYYRFTVRFFSSRPVREAYVRMMQLMNNYDNMAGDQRQEFDTRFKKALNLEVADRVIVAVDYATNDQNAVRDLRTFFETARTEMLKQQVYLITQHNGRVELREYFPPSSDGTGAKFVFPREVNGKPIIGPDDKEVRFDFFAPVVNERIFIPFKTSRMKYRDELTY
jgi:hypothetical protein